VDRVAQAFRFFDALESSDLATLEAMCAPDMSIWHNYDLQERSLRNMISDLSKMQAAFKEFSYAKRDYLALPDGSWLEHELVGVTSDGRPVRIPMAVRIVVDESDRIARIREYADVTQVRLIINGAP
jgi:ketosteroid isomerase-like protein